MKTITGRTGAVLNATATWTGAGRFALSAMRSRQKVRGMTMSKSYDSKCYDLAVKFLEDHYDPVPVLQAQELAGEIQDCIESWLEAEDKANAPKPEPQAWEFLNNEFQKIFGGK